MRVKIGSATLVDQADSFLMNSGRIMNLRPAFMFRPEFMWDQWLEAYRESLALSCYARSWVLPSY
jgi:hypothetical protein